jgi:hypothetical protein
MYPNIESALMQQVLAAVPHKHFQLLADEETGFATVSTLVILNHLDVMYGKITDTEISANLKDLTKLGTLPLTLKSLWTHIHKFRASATAAANPISEQTAIRFVITNPEGTGLFTADIRDWNKLPAVAHTLEALMDHFNLADDEHCCSSLSNEPASMAMPFLWLLVKQALDAPTVPVPAASPTVAPTKPFYCCWSHGIGPNHSHTSSTCRIPLASHCHDATLKNMKGGCDRIHRHEGDTAVTVPPTPKPVGTRNTAAATCAEN